MSDEWGHEGHGVATGGGGGWGASSAWDAGDYGDCGGDFNDGEDEMGGGHDDGDGGPVHYGQTVRGQVSSDDAAPMSAEWGNYGLGGGGGGWGASSAWGAGDFVHGDAGEEEEEEEEAQLSFEEELSGLLDPPAASICGGDGGDGDGGAGERFPRPSAAAPSANNLNVLCAAEDDAAAASSSFVDTEVAAAAAAAAAATAAAPSAFTSNFTNAKAGMEGVDKAKVQRVVYEMSKDSPHFANESRKEEAVERRIAEMKAAHARRSTAELAGISAAVELQVARLEAGRDLTRTWVGRCRLPLSKLR